MKLKALKNHFYGTKFKRVGSEYMADIKHSGIVIRSGVCEQVKMPTRKPKPPKAPPARTVTSHKKQTKK